MQFVWTLTLRLILHSRFLYLGIGKDVKQFNDECHTDKVLFKSSDLNSTFYVVTDFGW